MKTVLVTGADGMLGSETMRYLALDRTVRAVGTTLATLDITNLAQVRETLHRERPTHVIHCAAYTFVDLAEKESQKAYQVNAEGTKNLAFFCRELDAEMIYVSTDYVFDGAKGAAYVEGDRTAPLNVYGMSKLLGEVYVQTLVDRHKVVRTSWLNGLGPGFQRNFIETMLRLSESRSSLSLVSDQSGRPTFTFDLARALVTLLDVNAYGVFHATNLGDTTWFDFAQEIFAQAGKPHMDLRPILSEQFRSAARRPAFSVLANNRFAELGLPAMPHWRESLREYFRRRDRLHAATRPAEARPGRMALA